MPRSCCPPGKKRVALLPIAVNEPILATKISGAGQGASIAALLPDGMRAAAVRINDVSGVAGFVQPNDRVDVLITRQSPAATATSRSPTCCSRTSASSRSTRMPRTPTARRRSPRPRRSRSIRSTRRSSRWPGGRQPQPGAAQARREQNNPVVETVSLNDLRYSMYGGARYPAPAAVGGLAARAGRAVAARRAAAAPRRAARRAEAAPATAASRSSGEPTSNQYEVGDYGS